MTGLTNRRITLTSRPEGMPKTSDFSLVEEPVGEVPPEHVLVRNDTLSIDAFIRTTLDAGDAFHGSAALGTPVVALGVGEVIASESAALKVGDWVSGPLMAQTHALVPAMMVQKISPAENLPPSTYLGILGLTTGLTAWVGMSHVAGVQAGQTVMVSGAAGAVGTVASQLAKARGATVIGIAGGPTKCEFLTGTLGLDHAVDYKNDDVAARVKEVAPDGIDIYFDNVGGELLDVALDNLAQNGTVCLCGAVSQYQNMDDVRGPKLYLRIAERCGRMLGFTVDKYPQCYEEASREMTELMHDGKLQLPEHIIEGVDQFPDALIGLLTGGHMGKMLVKPT